MKLNKAIKGLILFLPIVIIVSCNLDKVRDNEQIYANSKNDISNPNYKTFSKENVSIQMQKLRQSNIIYFSLDQYNIQPEFTKILDQHVDFIRHNPSCKITIEGHTDERGTPEYNIALGENRANAVKMYLQGKGVLANQILVISYGKEKPAIIGHDEASYAKNRRAVIIY